MIKKEKILLNSKVHEIIKEKLPQPEEIIEIRKGFSNEKKYLITADNKRYLLREAGNSNSANKKKEFDLVKECYEKGVKCNQPIDFFEKNKSAFSLYKYIEGTDGERTIEDIDQSIQFQIGIDAGKDLKKINSIKRKENCSWLERKWKKHEYYINEYKKLEYTLSTDSKIMRFIHNNYGKIKLENDYLQHDDFHLGNIIIDNKQYKGIIDFNRYDWGDPLHEFVKMECFSNEFSKDFVRGQVKGYFGTNKIGEEKILTIFVYVAMSLFSMIVWTLKYHPKTFNNIEPIINRICDKYSNFDELTPGWAE